MSMRNPQTRLERFVMSPIGPTVLAVAAVCCSVTGFVGETWFGWH